MAVSIPMSSFQRGFALGVTTALGSLIPPQLVNSIRGADHFDFEGFQYLLAAVINGAIGWTILLFLWLAFWFLRSRLEKRP